MWAGYQMTGFYDPQNPNANPLDGLKYNSFPIINCSLDITLLQFPNAPLQDSVILSWSIKSDEQQSIWCKTTVNQTVLAQQTSSSPNPIGLNLGQKMWGGGCLSENGPLNITCTIQVWTLLVQALLFEISPLGSNNRSIFDLSVQDSGLASMALSYSGILTYEYSHLRLLGPP